MVKGLIITMMGVSILVNLLMACLKVMENLNGLMVLHTKVTT
jgi:hypothetical protein